MATNNYSISFRSLRAHKLYIVTIGGGSGDPIPLKGGAQPFTTEEDASEDQFEPVRTSTGYFRIVDDGLDANGNAFDWKDLIPATDTARPVTLKDNVGTTLWQGFMQAQNFGSTLYGNPQEREFPIQCCISVLNSMQVTTNPTQLNNFAYLLYDSFVTKFSGISEIGFAQFVIQGGYDAQRWLMNRFDWQNFLRETDENDLEPAYTHKEALEEMCKYWGWTLRTKGTSVYLTAMDDQEEQTLLTLTTANLQTMAGGTTAGTVANVGTAIALAGDIFASIENDDYLNRGPNKATVNANANEHETVLKVFPPYIENQLENSDQGWTWHSPQNNRIGWFESAQVGSFETSLTKGQGDGSTGGFSIRQVFESEDADEAADCDMILFNHQYTGQPVITLETKKPMSFAGGSLKITGTIYFDDAICDWPVGSSLRIALGIGLNRATARWWYMNNTAYEDPDDFLLDCGWSNQGVYRTFGAFARNGRLKSTGCLNVASQSVIGLAEYEYIPIDASLQGMFGKLYIDIMGFRDYEGNYRQVFQVADFKVDFVREAIKLPTTTGQTRARVKYPERKGTKKYTATNQNSAQDQWNIDTSFASDNLMKWGFGLVLDKTTCAPVGKQSYNNNTSSQYPEQHLANRVTSYWANSKRRLKTDLRLDALTSPMREPTPAEKVTLDGTTLHPIAINHEWRDDVVTLYLLQM